MESPLTASASTLKSAPKVATAHGAVGLGAIVISEFPRQQLNLLIYLYFIAGTNNSSSLMSVTRSNFSNDDASRRNCD